MDGLKDRFKNTTKNVLKGMGKKLLIILLPIIIIIVILAASYYYITEDYAKKGNEQSKTYTNNVTIKSGNDGKLKIEAALDRTIDSKLAELGKSEEEIANMSDVDKLKLLGFSDDVTMDNISAVDALWKTSDVFSKYLESAEQLERLLNAEIITQYPYIDGNNSSSINGIIKFKRKLQDGGELTLTYVSEDTFNSYKTTYENNPSSANKATLQSVFTMTEKGVIKIATFDQEGIVVTTDDDEFTLEKANEQFGENGTYTMQETSNGYIGTNYSVNIQQINYLNMVEKYTMPFEYLWAMTVIADDKGAFAEKLAQYCYDSEIVITIYDNIATYTEEDEYTYKRQNKTETSTTVEINPDYEIEYKKEDFKEDEVAEIDCPEYIIDYQKIKVTNTITSGLTKADTWVVNFEAQYNSINNTEEKPEEGEKIEIDTSTEYRQVGETRNYTYNILTGIATGDANLLNNEHEKELLEEANQTYKTKENEYLDQIILSHNYTNLSSFMQENTSASVSGEEKEQEEKNIKTLLQNVDSYDTLENITPSEINEIDGIEFGNSASELRYLLRTMAMKYVTEEYENIKVAITSAEEKDFEREFDISQLHYEYSSDVYYSKGTTTSKEAVDSEDGKTLKFVKAFNSSSKARSNILEVSSWLFEILEEDDETENMVDLTKYLLNQATDSTDYGSDLDFDVIWTSMFKGNLATTGDISLTTPTISRDNFIKALEEYDGGNNYVECFRNNAGKIYDIAEEVGVNPEIVIMKARGESSFKKGSADNYNFWGYNTPNGKSLYVLNANCEENAGNVYGTDDFEVALYVYCNYLLKYLPGGSLASSIEERYQQRLEANCNPNGYGEVGTFKGYLSVYSWVGDNHIVGDSGAGGIYVLKIVYGDEFDEKCGAYEDGSVGAGGHKLGDKTTIQEQADYTAWQYDQQIKIWEETFGNYGSINNLTSNGVVRTENQSSMEQILNADWANSVESEELKIFINKLFGELGKSASDYGFDDEWCAMWTSTMFKNYGPSGFITKRIDSVNGIIEISGSIQTAEKIYNGNSSAFSTKDTSYVPKPGDICLWKGQNSDGSVASHIGIVYACDGEYVWMIDGNAGTTQGWKYSHVINRVISINDSRISGYYPSSQKFK